jgi:hypothetical protein
VCAVQAEADLAAAEAAAEIDSADAPAGLDPEVSAAIQVKVQKTRLKSRCSRRSLYPLVHARACINGRTLICLFFSQ